MLPPTMPNRLDNIIDENKKIIFQPPPKENIPNIPTEDLYIDDDFTSVTKSEKKLDIGQPNFDGHNITLTRPETKLVIGKPNFDGDNTTMTPNNDKTEIKKSLLQTTIDIKNKKNTTITQITYKKASVKL